MTILVDANLLVYASARNLPQHPCAQKWLDTKLSGSARVGLPWASLLAFVRLVSNPRIFSRPLSVAKAFTLVEKWLDQPCVWTPEPTEDHRGTLAQLLGGEAIHSKLVPDAHLAALAIEHGLVLCSTDGDFARFRALTWVNPIST